MQKYKVLNRKTKETIEKNLLDKGYYLNTKKEFVLISNYNLEMTIDEFKGFGISELSLKPDKLNLIDLVKKSIIMDFDNIGDFYSSVIIKKK